MLWYCMPALSNLQLHSIHNLCIKHEITKIKLSMLEEPILYV